MDGDQKLAARRLQEMPLITADPHYPGEPVEEADVAGRAPSGGCLGRGKSSKSTPRRNVTGQSGSVPCSRSSPRRGKPGVA